MSASRVLGFGGSGHDWAVAAIADGRIVAAVAEERTSRLKYGIGSDLLRSSALEAVLEAAKWRKHDVTAAVACDLVPLPLVFPFRDRMHRIRHHLSHAYSAYYGSGFEQCAVLVADHSGSPVSGGFSGAQREVETITGWQATPEGIELLFQVTGDHRLEVMRKAGYYQHVRVDNSLGDLYRLASETLGFVSGSGPDSVSDDGKTMGLAAYGELSLYPRLREHAVLGTDRPFHMPMRDGRVAALFEEHLRGSSPELLFARKAEIAAATQQLLQDAIVHLAKHLRQLSGMSNLAMAGGVVLNCVANTAVAQQAGFDAVFAFPAAGDDGTALGSALYASARICGVPPVGAADELPYYGPTCLQHDRLEPLDRDRIDRLVELLGQGATIGWFEGRSEFGPRALGHRSILADPRHPEIRERINAVTKRRELFRPLAPMVLAQEAEKVFDFPQAAFPMLPYMLATVKVRPEWVDRILAVCHVDGTARIQTVDSTRLPAVHALLSAWAEATGVPVLLNTSFNRAGEPIVETERDALRCFDESDLDCIVLNGTIFEKYRQ